ncbi:WAT1-related protein [Platanthera zijinensis]|uniref:WAT1-related protein n=1 Tax=Platanthera zijinensis TaxID=2320716 RepID=A0AAP0BZJ7_9ASPA
MILCQLGYSVMHILLKIAMEQGLSHHVLVAYRHLLATAISAPIAYVLERKQRPSLSFLILVKIFFLALLGITVQQNIFFAGLSYTSPTVAGAMSTAIPALTFILAVLLRTEKVRIKTTKGRVKILGTVVCVTGALVFTFWRGHMFEGFWSKPLIIVPGTRIGNGSAEIDQSWIQGSLVILIGQVVFSAWIVFQGVIFEEYPAKLSFNAWMCFFASLQSLVEALIFERNMSAWQLGWNIQLVAVLYTGIVVSFLVYNLQLYCISEKGPLFSAIFFPVSLVILAILSAIFFAERLHLGSLVGAIIIIIGLYAVLWGKSGDGHDEEKENMPAEKENQIVAQKSASFCDISPV